MLITRTDKRQAKWDPETIKGIPVVQNYKYLGVVIVNNLKFKLQEKGLRDFKNKFLGLLSAPINHKLPSEARLNLWRSLCMGKASYGNLQLAAISEQISEQMNSVIYQSLKTLLLI